VHRRAPEADTDLDDIVIGIAERGGSFQSAQRLVASITERFYLLSEYPYLGRSREADLGGGRRSYVVGEHVIIYRVEDGDVLILRVVHGRRDIEALFQELPARSRDAIVTSAPARPEKGRKFAVKASEARCPTELGE
jgi:toxin ParE1/3/4